VIFGSKSEKTTRWEKLRNDEFQNSYQIKWNEMDVTLACMQEEIINIFIILVVKYEETTWNT
jgi:hypothetical protein